jgi:hypothetical protein
MTLLPIDFTTASSHHGGQDPVEIEIVYCDPDGEPERRRRMPLAAFLGTMPRVMGMTRPLPPERMRARP